ncbi:MAG TPA: hypothetical protein VEY51_05975 [Chondromyces sp.]|nr:hypothetical protein [Chondromyces sp.]
MKRTIAASHGCTLYQQPVTTSTYLKVTKLTEIQERRNNEGV